jgi:hypothetical protein
MSFFNKKEEVMEVQVTQYGKYLLSKGQFKPEFYAFSDDEVLYDASYGENVNETAKTSFERIQNDTVRMRPLYEHEGAETRVTKTNKHIMLANLFRNIGASQKRVAGNLYGKDYVDDLAMVPDDRKLMRSILGSSEVGNKYAPAWCIYSLNDQEFESPIQLSSSGPNRSMRRPQINLIVDYDMESELVDVGDTITMNEYFQQDGTGHVLGFVDGYELTIDTESIVLEVIEKNVSTSDDKFDVEFFLVESEEEFSEGGTTVKEEKLLTLKVGTEFDATGRDELSTYVEVLFDEHSGTSIPEDFEGETFYGNVGIEDEQVCD